MTTPEAIFFVCLIIAHVILLRDVERMRRRINDLALIVQDLADQEDDSDEPE